MVLVLGAAARAFPNRQARTFRPTAIALLRRSRPEEVKEGAFEVCA